MTFSDKSSSAFGGSRNRIHINDLQDDEERANAAYAEKHNLQSLFSEIAEHLTEKNPKTETETEQFLLEFLSHRKAERDRAALRLHFSNSFEVNLYNGRKIVKLQVGQENSALQLEQKGRIWSLEESFEISLEEMEELTEVFYELGRFVVDGTKGEQGGFIRVDDRDVYFLSAMKECMEAGDEFFDLALHVCMRRKKDTSSR